MRRTSSFSNPNKLSGEIRAAIGSTGSDRTCGLLAHQAVGAQLRGALSTATPTQHFAAGKTIAKPIETLEIGDIVWAWDEATGQRVKRLVRRLFRHEGRAILAVCISTGDGQRQIIEATTEHPFWVKGKGWVAACTLKEGDVLLGIDPDKHCTVAAHPVESGTANVFNFEVNEVHNYFVGRRGVLVHNSSSESIQYETTQLAGQSTHVAGSILAVAPAAQATPSESGTFSVTGEEDVRVMIGRRKFLALPKSSREPTSAEVQRGKPRTMVELIHQQYFDNPLMRDAQAIDLGQAHELPASAVGRLVGMGATKAVFQSAVEPDQALVFSNHGDSIALRMDHTSQRMLATAGAPAAMPGEWVLIDGRYGYKVQLNEDAITTQDYFHGRMPNEDVANARIGTPTFYADLIATDLVLKANDWGHPDFQGMISDGGRLSVFDAPFLTSGYGVDHGHFSNNFPDVGAIASLMQTSSELMGTQTDTPDNVPATQRAIATPGSTTPSYSFAPAAGPALQFEKNLLDEPFHAEGSFDGPKDRGTYIAGFPPKPSGLVKPSQSPDGKHASVATSNPHSLGGRTGIAATVRRIEPVTATMQRSIATPSSPRGGNSQVNQASIASRLPVFDPALLSSFDPRAYFQRVNAAKTDAKRLVLLDFDGPLILGGRNPSPAAIEFLRYMDEVYKPYYALSTTRRNTAGRDALYQKADAWGVGFIRRAIDEQLWGTPVVNAKSGFARGAEVSGLVYLASERHGPVVPLVADDVMPKGQKDPNDGFGSGATLVESVFDDFGLAAFAHPHRGLSMNEHKATVDYVFGPDALRSGIWSSSKLRYGPFQNGKPSPWYR